MAGRPVLDEAIAGQRPPRRPPPRAASTSSTRSRDPARADEMEQLLERFGEVQGEYQQRGRLRARGARPRGPPRPRLRRRADRRRRRRALGRLEDARRDGEGPPRQARRPPHGRADEPPRHRVDPLARGVPRRAIPGSLLMTCHDRDFMNRVVTKIVEIDGGELVTYSGNYDFYERERSLREAQREAAFARQQAMLAKEQRFIERFQTHAAKAAQVQSRVKKLEKIETIELPKKRAGRAFRLQAAAALRRRRRASSRSCRRPTGARRLYTGFDFLIRRGERWCVMGVNGAGKTTLLKMVAGVLPPDGGARAPRREREDGLLLPAGARPPRPRADRPRAGPEGLSRRGPRRPARPRRRVPVLRRRRRQDGPVPLRRREVAPRHGAHALRPAELPRPRRADEPPRPRHEGDARRGALEVRGDDALRLARPHVPARPREPRPRADRRGRHRPRRTPTAARTWSGWRAPATRRRASTHNRPMSARAVRGGPRRRRPPRPRRRRARALLPLDDLGRARAPRGRARVAPRTRHGLELRAPGPHEGARGRLRSRARSPRWRSTRRARAARRCPSSSPASSS